MKVLIVDPSLYTAPYDGELGRALQQSGMQVSLLARAPRDSDEEQWLQGLHRISAYPSSEKIRDRWPRFYRFLKVLEHFKICRQILKLVKTKQVDVVHFQWSVLPLLDQWLLLILRDRCPIILTYHDSHHLHGEGVSFVQRQGLTKFVDSCDKIIVHTQATRKHLEEMGIQNEKICTVPHGPLPLFSEKVESSSRDKLLLTFGSLRPYKGIDIILQSWQRLSPSIKQGWRLRIMGGGDADYIKSLQQVVSDGVEWQLGRFSNEELAGQLKRAAAVVFAHRDIDASGAFFTAAPAGVPIVGPRLGSFAELENDLPQLFLFDSKSAPDSLTSVMENFMSSTDNGLNKMEDLTWPVELSWKHIATLTRKAYTSGG